MTDPILLSEVRVDGIAGKAAIPGMTAQIITRLVSTSDDKLFHLMADSLCSVINFACEKDGIPPPKLKAAETILLVIQNDYSARLWVDTAVTALQIITKRQAEAGSAIFERDIADITEMDFPFAEIKPEDKVVCLFRIDWRFGIFCDFNPDKSLAFEEMRRDLGTLNRTLKYRHQYDLIADSTNFDILTGYGWFPFVEIFHDLFPELAQGIQAGFPQEHVEKTLIEKFSDDRVEAMLQRWLTKPHFASREPILRSAVRSYLADDPIAVIKTVSTEIEGVLSDAYKAANGTSSKIKGLIEFATSLAKQRAGSGHSLLMTENFATYLSETMFANFDPEGPLGDAGSRHAVGHGAADPATYTKARALQALLTLDQFVFYT